MPDPARCRHPAGLTDLKPMPGTVPLHSSVWGRLVEGEELDARYWFENLRLPVRFADAAQAVMDGARPTVFVELSPHPLLRSSLEEEIEAGGGKGAVVSSLERAEPEADVLATALARAYGLGCRPAWERLHPEGGFVPLPAYRWQRRRFWPDSAKSAQPPKPAASGPSRPDLAALTEAELAASVARLAAQVLAVPGHEVAVDTPLTHLGLDSVLAMRFRDRMRRDLGVDVPLRNLLGPATLRELATELRASL